MHSGLLNIINTTGLLNIINTKLLSIIKIVLSKCGPSLDQAWPKPGLIIPRGTRTSNLQEQKSFLPKMLATFGLIGTTPGPLWGHYKEIVPWARDNVQNKTGGQKCPGCYPPLVDNVMHMCICCLGSCRTLLMEVLLGYSI